jgi:hypothetical protein
LEACDAVVAAADPNSLAPAIAAVVAILAALAGRIVTCCHAAQL